MVRGRQRLSGAPVRATDIRAGAGLVLAGLVADGVTTVVGSFHIDRGYPLFVENLKSLGAEIERVGQPVAPKAAATERLRTDAGARVGGLGRLEWGFGRGTGV